MINWNISGYFGVFFAMVYRLPQIRKIYKTKKAGDISRNAFVLHNAAYLSLMIYVLTNDQDLVLLTYYSMGLIQNLIIIGMKKYYKNLEMINNNKNITTIMKEFEID